MGNNKMHSLEQAAKILGVHPTTLKRWIKSGLVEPACTSDGPVRQRSFFTSEQLEVLKSRFRDSRKPFTSYL